MRMKRLIERQRYVMVTTCLMILGFYLGRVSLRKSWLEVLVPGLWVFNALMWGVPLLRALRQEEAQFRREMRQIGEEVRRNAGDGNETNA